MKKIVTMVIAALVAISMATAVSGTITMQPDETYNAGPYVVKATASVGSAAATTLTIEQNGTFSFSANLIEGANTITVTAVGLTRYVGKATITVTQTVTPWATYGIIIVIIALILAAIAIIRRR